jgi:predicted dinucleotide-binding enzyme
MKISILGTGVVAQTLADKLDAIGHQVTLGTRDPEATRARDKPVRSELALATFADAAASGELVICALSGAGALEALDAAGAERLAGKILIDISNPLDFSKGFPPTLTVCNTDSLGEQIQRRLPATRVVKTLNTVSASIMVDPGQLAGGDHTMFVCGDDADARDQVAGWLREWFGWKDIVQLAGIANARGTEMYLPMWVRLYGALGTPAFSIKLVR